MKLEKNRGWDKTQEKEAGVKKLIYKLLEMVAVSISVFKKRITRKIVIRKKKTKRKNSRKTGEIFNRKSFSLWEFITSREIYAMLIICISTSLITWNYNSTNFPIRFTTSDEWRKNQLPVFQLEIKEQLQVLQDELSTQYLKRIKAITAKHCDLEGKNHLAKNLLNMPGIWKMLVYSKQ